MKERSNLFKNYQKIDYQIFVWNIYFSICFKKENHLNFFIFPPYFSKQKIDNSILFDASVRGLHMKYSGFWRILSKNYNDVIKYALRKKKRCLIFVHSSYFLVIEHRTHPKSPSFGYTFPDKSTDWRSWWIVNTLGFPAHIKHRTTPLESNQRWERKKWKLIIAWRLT